MFFHFRHYSTHTTCFYSDKNYMDKTARLISWQTFLKYSNDAIKLRLAAFQNNN